ncbi:MAG TPA: hemerythrin domain-containing protein [Gemmatimonadaceae bacterium]|nr:hemerythrin domain-containing protein [Gemmatimonadaceae bacterium]
MTTSYRLLGSIAATTLGLSILGVTASARASAWPARVAETQQPAIHIPASVRSEHQEIHAALVAATKAKGKVGAAARDLARILDPHFRREEQIALPPLGLLAPLSRGEFNTQMRDVLPMTDSLRAELPRMLEEHKAIHAATERMGQAARAQNDAKVARLAEQLALHAQSEEEVYYPAAVLVGDLVRARATGARK